MPTKVICKYNFNFNMHFVFLSVHRMEFKVGERVEAVWSTDGNRYPGVVQAKLSNGKST